LETGNQSPPRDRKKQETHEGDPPELHDENQRKSELEAHKSSARRPSGTRPPSSSVVMMLHLPVALALLLLGTALAGSGGRPRPLLNAAAALLNTANATAADTAAVATVAKVGPWSAVDLGATASTATSLSFAEGVLNPVRHYTLTLHFKHDERLPIPDDPATQCDPTVVPPVLAPDGMPYYAGREMNLTVRRSFSFLHTCSSHLFFCSLSWSFVFCLPCACVTTNLQ
jgi:hypothetical protein